MADETIITDCYEFTNEGMGLYFAPISDPDIFLDLDKRTDKNMVAHDSTVNVTRVDDSYLLTELCIYNSYVFI